MVNKVGGIAAPFYTLIFYSHIVIKTLQIKLLPDDDQKQAIIDTFTKFNEACNFVSRTAFEKKLYNKVFLQRIVYRYIHNSWSFHQLMSFIEYKAREAGIPVILVNPHNTSRECPDCHSIDKRNRPERSQFRCISCGIEGEADFVASLNIRNRAAVSQPIVAGAIFDHVIRPVASQRASAVGG